MCLQTVCPVPLSTYCNITSWLCPVATGNGDVCREHLGLVAALKSVKCVDSPPAAIKQLKEPECVSCVSQSSQASGAQRLIPPPGASCQRQLLRINFLHFS